MSDDPKLSETPETDAAPVPTPPEEAPSNAVQCPGCGCWMDPDVCWCGDLMKNHGYDGHSPVPMGCDCGRIKEPAPVPLREGHLGPPQDAKPGDRWGAYRLDSDGWWRVHSDETPAIAPVPATAPALTPHQIWILQNSDPSFNWCGYQAAASPLVYAGLLEAKEHGYGITEAGRRALREQGS